MSPLEGGIDSSLRAWFIILNLICVLLITNQINTSRVVWTNQNKPTKEVALFAQYIKLLMQYKAKRDHFILLKCISYCLVQNYLVKYYIPNGRKFHLKCYYEERRLIQTMHAYVSSDISGFFKTIKE